MTIVLADPEPVVRAGLAALLDAELDLRVLAGVGDLVGAERMLAAHRPDVLVLEARLADGPSLPALGRLRSVAAGARVVVLTGEAAPAVVREALREGAGAYVLKTGEARELFAAVRAVAAGRSYLSPELGARLAAADEAGPSTPDDLSSRELEVLRLIALGHVNPEIAARLHLSVRTVEAHRAHIQQKTRLATRAQLSAYAREHRLV